MAPVIRSRVRPLQQVETRIFLHGEGGAAALKTINGQSITGTGDIAIPKGDKGDPGVSWTVTVVTDQAAYEAAMPGANELIVRV